jgi:transcriptional regulator with XRE-family HTH domain
MTGNLAATQELAAFLRACRERLTPVDVDLPERRRPRRTPGLRREEVAELAGVSVDYVVRLEQGRGLRPSPDVLDALARALRLNDDERIYLFDLAQQRPASRRRTNEESVSPLAALVRDLSPLPAMLLNHRLDIVAWNDEMAQVMIDFDTLPYAQRNALWLCILHPAFRDFYRDRARVIREGIADLRAAWAAHPDDKALADLVTELASHSDEFAWYWAQHDVRVNGRGRKQLMHPLAGLLTIDFEVLTPLQDRDQRLVLYRAADDASKVALDKLFREIPRRPRATSR